MVNSVRLSQYGLNTSDTSACEEMEGHLYFVNCNTLLYLRLDPVLLLSVIMLLSLENTPLD